MEQGPLVTARDLAAYFGVTVETVNRWVRENRVPFIRASRRVVRFRIAEVERVLRGRSAKEGEIGAR